MAESFETNYAKYLESLAKLDKTDDIAQKNLLFRELAQLLSEMESSLKSNSTPPDNEDSVTEGPDPTYWI